MLGLGLLTGLEFLEIKHLIYLRLSAGCDMLVFFTNSRLWYFRSDIWPYFFFLSNRWLWWFWMGNDIQDTVNWGKKCLVDFNTGKTQLVSFDRSDNSSAIDVKMNGSVLEKKNHLLRCWG